jgi:hypothetical protein
MLDRDDQDDCPPILLIKLRIVFVMLWVMVLSRIVDMVNWLFATQTVFNMMFAPFPDSIIYVGGAFACLISLMVKPMGSLHVHLLGDIHYSFLKEIRHVGAFFCHFYFSENDVVA